MHYDIRYNACINHGATEMTNDYTSLKSFSPEFASYFDAAPMDELLDAYCENYKDAHGIKARWIYSSDLSRMELARYFDILAREIKAEREREAEHDAAFRNSIDSVGLTEWAARNNIHTQYDLYDHQHELYWRGQQEPEADAYEALAIRKGYLQ